ncbi:MAG: hypothetical protein ACP5K5_01960 [Candidatus Micrarchaeia archaeon]
MQKGWKPPKGSGVQFVTGNTVNELSSKIRENKGSYTKVNEDKVNEDSDLVKFLDSEGSNKNFSEETIDILSFSDPLTEHIKGEVAAEVSNFIKSNNAFCDPEDLKKQVLFRLLSYPLHMIFENGEKLEAYFDNAGANKDWHKILSLDKDYIRKFRVNASLLGQAFKEQYAIISDRLSKSTLPLKDLIYAGGIFREKGWYIETIRGSIYARCSTYSRISQEAIPLELREVDTNYAKRVFNDLHYMHAPRADLALGLFISGQKYPFSVVGICKIDRDYKKLALRLRGYNPDKCFEITRLYNIFGSPMNTSSFMMASAVRYLKLNYPDTEVCTTTITPSLETGHSLFSGGFRDPLLAKPERLLYCETDKGIRRVTHRLVETINKKPMVSQVNLLPKLVMARYLKGPRWKPIVDKGSTIIFGE